VIVLTIAINNFLSQLNSNNRGLLFNLQNVPAIFKKNNMYLVLQSGYESSHHHSRSQACPGERSVYCDWPADYRRGGCYVVSIYTPQTMFAKGYTSCAFSKHLCSRTFGNNLLWTRALANRSSPSGKFYQMFANITAYWTHCWVTVCLPLDGWSDFSC